MSISEMKIFRYECEDCFSDYLIINKTEIPSFCSYCGKKPGVKKYAPEEDFGGISEEVASSGAPSIVHNPAQKSPKILEAEDRLTDQRCSTGWWNPITKQCQGEGNGKDLDAWDKITT
jgi:hypothetical protein